MVDATKSAAELEYSFVMGFGIANLEDYIVEIALDDARFLRRREIARDGGIGSKQIIVVWSAVIGILILFRKDPHDGVRYALNRDHGTYCGLPGEKLLLGGRSQHYDAPRFLFILLANQTSGVQL